MNGDLFLSPEIKSQWRFERDGAKEEGRGRIWKFYSADGNRRTVHFCFKFQ